MSPPGELLTPVVVRERLEAAERGRLARRVARCRSEHRPWGARCGICLIRLGTWLVERTSQGTEGRCPRPDVFAAGTAGNSAVAAANAPQTPFAGSPCSRSG